MKNGLLTVIALICCFPGSIEAQTVTVRSGEHPTFSRLVFASTPGRIWELRTDTPGRADIVFSDPLPELDLSSIFDRIPRARIAGSAASGRTFSLDLTCDCPVSVFQIASGHIVIDVGDGVPINAKLQVAQAVGLRLPLRLEQRPFDLDLADFDGPMAGGKRRKRSGSGASVGGGRRAGYGCSSSGSDPSGWNAPVDARECGSGSNDPRDVLSPRGHRPHNSRSGPYGSARFCIRSDVGPARRSRPSRPHYSEGDRNGLPVRRMGRGGYALL